eukprot:bmy_17001T0
MEGISNVIQNGLRHTFGNSGGEKQYLTTVIPYEKKNGPPSIEDLQILTKILRAMKEDSEKVPSLLTDYILKGVDTEDLRKVASVIMGTLEEGRMKEGTVRSVNSPEGNMNGDGFCVLHRAV